MKRINTKYKGTGIGKYKSVEVNSDMNHKDYPVKIIYLYVKALIEDEYNKAAIEDSIPICLKPDSIFNVYTEYESKLYICDFYNTIIAPCDISVSNELPDGGSVGYFAGPFYGMLNANMRPATKKDIHPDAARIIPDALLKSIAYPIDIDIDKITPSDIVNIDSEEPAENAKSLHSGDKTVAIEVKNESHRDLIKEIDPDVSKLSPNIKYKGKCRGFNSVNPKVRDVDISEIIISDLVPYDYNKYDLADNGDTSLTARTIFSAVVEVGDEMMVCNFHNTVINNVEYKSDIPIPEGRVGYFEGDFYGVLSSEVDIRAAKKTDINPIYLHLMPKHEEEPLAETHTLEVDADTEARGYAEDDKKSKDSTSEEYTHSGRSEPSGCKPLLSQLLLLTISFLYLFILMEKGCYSTYNGKSQVLPCDTVYIHDTIYPLSEIPLKRSMLSDTIIINEDSTNIYLYDCQVIDGDVVTVRMNGVLLQKNLSLDSIPKIISIKLVKGENKLELQAVELAVAECTVGVIIYDKQGNVILERCEELVNKEKHIVNFMRQ
jgi:hypothetical protein